MRAYKGCTQPVRVYGAPPPHKVQLSARNPHLTATILAWVSGGPRHRQRIAGCLAQTVLQLSSLLFFFVSLLLLFDCKCLTLVRVCDEKSARATMHTWAPGVYCYPSCCSSVLGQQSYHNQEPYSTKAQTLDMLCFSYNESLAFCKWFHMQWMGCLHQQQFNKYEPCKHGSICQSAAHRNFHCLWQAQVAIDCLPARFVVGCNWLPCMRNLQ